MEARIGEAVAGALEVNLAELLRLRLTQEIPVAAPAAGADPSFSPPSGAAWEVLAVTGQLVTSAVVANRRPALRVTDQNGRFSTRVESAQTQAASLTSIYTWLAGLSAAIIGTQVNQLLPDPPLLVLPGRSLAFVTANLDVGDQWSALMLTVREWTFEEIVRQAEWLERHLPSGHE